MRRVTATPASPPAYPAHFFQQLRSVQSMAELNKSQPKGINVFCGSSFGNDPRFAACAVSVGEALAKADRELV